MIGETSIKISPGYHRCTDPAGNFGIRSAQILFTLKRDGWAIDWSLMPDWGQTPDAFNAQSPDCTHPRHQRGYPAMGKPQAGPVGWHSPVPIFAADDAPVAAKCEHTGGPCWGDAGYLLGDDVFARLLDGGDEAMWAFLDELLTDHQLRALELGVPS